MRPIWKGTLCFGLVNIGIKLFSACVDRELKFHLFHSKDKSPIKYLKICEKEQKEVDPDETVKGFEISKGKYVFLDDSDFEKANIHKTNSIEIESFAKIPEIDPIFYERPYYLVPEKTAQKAYYLLSDAMEQKNVAAIARFVLKNHEYLGAIIIKDKMMVLHQLRFLNEIKQAKVTIKNPVKSAKEHNIAVKLIEELSEKFNPEKYRDSYVEDLKDLIQKKAKGKKIVPKGKKPRKTKSGELFDALSESLKKRKKISA